MSSPPGLVIPPLMSDTAMIFAPASWHIRAAIEPTFPKPWTTTRLPGECESLERRRLAGDEHEAAPGRLHASAGAAEGERFAGHDRVTVWRACIE